jgi:predicted DNA-binding transcriptional regulator AlpA
LPPEALAELMGRCLAAMTALIAAQFAKAADGASSQARAACGDGDRLLDVADASAMTGLSRAQLYRNRNLPFRVRVGALQTRFSKRAIERWIRAKTERPKP